MAKCHFQRRWYYCRQAGPSEARYENICLRHQVLISLQFPVLVARKIDFHKLWRMVRWWP